MLDIGGAELLVIGLLLILVVGPKDLPRVLRTVGQFMAKMRGMTREFKKSIDEMAREADIDDLRKELNSVSDTVSGSVSDSNVNKKIEDTVDSTGVLRDALKEDYGSSGEAADQATSKLPPLPKSEASESEASSPEAAENNGADGAEPQPTEQDPAPAPTGQEKERAQPSGAAEA